MVGANIADTGLVGGKHVGLRPVLQDRGSSRPDIKVGYMHLDAPAGPDPLVLPPQGGPLAGG